jgi:Zn-dependent protease
MPMNTRVRQTIIRVSQRREVMGLTMIGQPGQAPAGSGPGLGNSRNPNSQRRDTGGFSVAGFSVRLTPGFYLLCMLAVIASALALPSIAPGAPALVYLAATAGFVAALLLSLVAHELAHAVVARRHGAATREIRIGFFGGGWHGNAEFTTPRALWRVAAAGPVASLIAAAVSAGAAAGLAGLGTGKLAVFGLALTAWVNILLAVVNVLPGAGLDGGRIVQAWAWARSGDRTRATITAARVGQYTGALLTAGGVALFALGYTDGAWAGLIGLLMVGAARAQAREVLAIAALSGLRVADVLRPGRPDAVSGWLTVKAFLEEEPHGGPGTAGGQVTTAAGTAFPVRDFDGRTAGLLTLSQLAAVPPPRRDAVRISDVATPVEHVVTTTLDEPLGHLVSRLAVRPAIPAALHTAGHALVLGDDGAPAGVLTPADFARARQLGALHMGAPP